MAWLRTHVARYVDLPSTITVDLPGDDEKPLFYIPISLKWASYSPNVVAPRCKWPLTSTVLLHQKMFATGMKRGRSYARSPISVEIPPICTVSSIKNTGARQKPSGISSATARPSGDSANTPTTLAHRTPLGPDTLTITNIHSHLSHPAPCNPMVSALPSYFIPSSPQRFRLPAPIPAMVSPVSPVSTYVNQYRHRFDALRFDAITEQRDQSGGNVEDRETAWVSRWRYVPCGVEIPNVAPWDLQWLRCEGEREFLSNLATIWSRFTPEDFNLPDGLVCRHLCPLPQPFYRMYWARMLSGMRSYATTLVPRPRGSN